jgi:YHS domain-containing protein
MSKPLMPGRDDGFAETSPEARHLSAMIRLTYRLFVLIVLLGIGGAMTLRGQTPGAINTTSGVAVQGYDVVSYLTEQRAVKGQPAFSHQWQGATWQFASAENRDRFARTPEAFAPQFGGFCAYGVSRGYAVEIDPQAFAIVDGELYLNYSKRVQATWNQDRGGYIEKARQNWPKVSAELFKKGVK